MRIYGNAYELMSEMGRNIYEMGCEVKPKTYQNKVIDGKEEFATKELICEQYCLLWLPDPEYLFIHTKCKDWADAEFKERISGECINPGDAWKLRKGVWEEFLTDNGIFDYTYAERMNQTVLFQNRYYTKLDAIVKLLKEDPDTRKAILDIYGVYNGTDSPIHIEDQDHLDGKKRIPCSMYYDFLIRANASGEKQLNICYHQRSSDFITHFGNDVYLAWRLMEYVAEQVGVKPGYLYHTIDSIHVYRKDLDKLKLCVEDLFHR